MDFLDCINFNCLQLVSLKKHVDEFSDVGQILSKTRERRRVEALWRLILCKCENRFDYYCFCSHWNRFYRMVGVVFSSKYKFFSHSSSTLLLRLFLLWKFFQSILFAENKRIRFYWKNHFIVFIFFSKMQKSLRLPSTPQNVTPECIVNFSWLFPEISLQILTELIDHSLNCFFVLVS